MRRSFRFPSLLLTSLLISSGLTVALSSMALALEPSSTTSVTQIKIDAPHAFSNKNQNAYFGKEGCKKMIANKSKVRVTYTTNFDTTLNAAHLNGVFSFEVKRHATAKIDCNGSPSICQSIDSSYVTQEKKEIVVELPFDKLTNMTNEADCDNRDFEQFLRVQLKKIITEDKFDDADARLIIDSVAPQAPELTSLESTTTTAVVEFKAPADQDLEQFALVYSKDALTKGETPDPAKNSITYFGTSESTKGTVKVTLESGETYYVGLAARDKTGNLSPLSDIKQITPTNSVDFWQAYQEAGGTAEGCNATGNQQTTPVLILISLVGIFVLNRKRRLTATARVFA